MSRSRSNFAENGVFSSRHEGAFALDFQSGAEFDFWALGSFAFELPQVVVALRIEPELRTQAGLAWH